jgi:hypothetical protein
VTYIPNMTAVMGDSKSIDTTKRSSRLPFSKSTLLVGVSFAILLFLLLQLTPLSIDIEVVLSGIVGFVAGVLVNERSRDGRIYARVLYDTTHGKRVSGKFYMGLAPVCEEARYLTIEDLSDLTLHVEPLAAIDPVVARAA